MAEGIVCQVCGVEAPTKFIEFHKNIGMLFMRRYQTMRGNLCKRCIHSYFWKYTLITLAVGWLGTISLIIAPIFIINNLVRYLGSLGMPAVPRGTLPPRLSEDEIKRLQAYAPEMIKRLTAKEPLVDVARSIAPQAKVTPGQILLFVRVLGSQPVQQPPVGGFPVMPVRAQPVAAKTLDNPVAPPPLPPPVSSPAAQPKNNISDLGL